MAKLSISKAAKEWGISRKTIQEAVRSGKLSTESGARNSKNVDVVDLLRVFGEPKNGKKYHENTGQFVSNTHVNTDFLNHCLEEIKDLKEKMKEEKSLFERLLEEKTVKIEGLERELTEYREYRKPVKRLGWFGWRK